MSATACSSDNARVGVMHVLDTLQVGGAERAAVDYVNHLPQNRYRPYLCTTRDSGPLEKLVGKDVPLLQLHRRSTLDLAPLSKLLRFISDENIAILHAHGSALFVSRLAQLLLRRSIVIWHLHFGRWAVDDRRDWRYHLMTLGVDGIVTSNDDLAQWICRRFPVRSSIVTHLPNMASAVPSEKTDIELPGKPGARIVCVANLRAEKDHITLLRAFAQVIAKHALAHLILVGGCSSQEYAATVEKCIDDLALRDHVSMLGCRQDVASILQHCDIGVLSSATEGLPVALLEYGTAGLATVATSVGQCFAVLNSGSCGLIVPPGSPALLADALDRLLSSESLRARFGSAFQRSVKDTYSPEQVIPKLCDLYDRSLAARRYFA